MTARATRTLNPLHFEDLEPHRFEDLVRQLVYDFRPWSQIEATGRLGADDGVDIRAVEGGEVAPDPAEHEDAADPPQRVWVIQCKREKEVGPKAVEQLVRDAVPGGGDTPYGLILAAACDFSKKAHDTFHVEATARGVREAYIWGKAALEDMLFLPRYDHLLFAYFNISLQVRRRSLKTAVRSRLATKRAAISALGGFNTDGPVSKTVLVRDPREDRYPREEEIPDFASSPRWLLVNFKAHAPPDHLAFAVREHFAYFDRTTERWDAVREYAIRPARPEFGIESFGPHHDDDYRASIKQWEERVPEEYRGRLHVVRYIHYDRVIAIDPDGDCVFPCPQVLVEFDPVRGPFELRERLLIETASYRSELHKVHDDQRVDYFAARPIANGGDAPSGAQ
jgi:hypothetical protein